MGEIHKASLDGVKLEGACKEHGPILAFLFSFWFVLYVALQQKDEKVKSAVMKGAICMFLTLPLCYAGWIWGIMWAIAAKKQS